MEFRRVLFRSVGMSQYGANVYAKNGYSYADILAHYYPGTELVSG